MSGRRLLVSLFILLLMAPMARAADQSTLQFSLSFDGFLWYSVSPDDSWTQGHNDTYALARTYYFTTALPVYWSFVFVNVSHHDPTGQDRYIERRVLVKVLVDGVQVASQSKDAVFHDGYYEFYIPFFTAGLASNLTVEIYSSTGDTTDRSTAEIEYTVREVKVLMTSTEKGFMYDTRAVDQTDIPAGAGGTSKSLRLDRTELTLSGYSLDQGSLALWVKWDGQPVRLLNNLEIDPTGHVIFYSSEAGYNTTFTVPEGKFVPLYISWKPGEMYIMLSNQSTENRFTFSGTVQIGSIGSLNQSTSTLIDEIRIWSVYMSEEDILASLGSVSYGISVGDMSISVVPEGGPTLPTLYATFLDENFNALSNTTITKANSNVAAPSETAYIALKSSTGAERLYYLKNMSTESVRLAYPALEAKDLGIIKVQLPAGYDTLEVWTLRGDLIYRVRTSESVTSFVGLLGSYYRFTVEGPNVTAYSVIKQVDGSLITLVPPDIASVVDIESSKEYLEVERDSMSGIVTAIYHAPTPKTVTLNLVIFDQNGTAIINTTDTKNTSLLAWSFLMPPNAAYAVISAKADGFSASKTVPGQLNPHGWINENLLPGGLILILLASIGTFAVTRKNAAYAPLLIWTLITVAQYVGFISISTGTYALLSILAVLGLYTSREG